MRALLSRKSGGPEALEIAEIPPPVAAAGEVVIAVKACALNFPDTLIIEDKYQVRPERPFAPGGEVAGIIEAVGDGVTDFAPGDRVMALTSFGGLADLVAVRVSRVFPLPPERDFVDGAALLMTYGTAIHALIDRGQLREGETLLIMGAAGGVGIAAVELGKAYGARVIGAVSSPEKALAVREAGADDVIIYGRAPFDREQSKALADAFKAAVGPGGADVIYDGVGGDYCEPALRSIAWNGRYLVIGFPAGIPRLPLNLVLLKSCDVRGVAWGATATRDPALAAANVGHLLDFWRKGQIKPRITQVLPFTRAAEGIANLSARAAIGKIVVTLP